MLISIITPTYNRADLLIRTIKSVKQQTFENWELIIVDDGSTDDTEKKIETFLEDKRINFIKKENSGATHSRNVGVNHANGDFVTFSDSDDEAYPNWLQVVSSLIDDNTGFICVGAIRKMLNGQLIKELPAEFKFYDENVKIKFTCGSLIINKAIFYEVGGYDTNLKSNQHTDLGFRLLKKLYRSSIEKKYSYECLIQINVHEGARIRNNWKLVRDGGIQFLDKHYDYFRKNDKKGLAAIYGAIAFGSYKLNKKKESIKFTLKAIECNPRIIKNYFRLIRYAL